VGLLPNTLPSPGLPPYDFGELRLLLPLALGCFLLAFVEDVTAARTFAEADRAPLDANRELLALGAGNLVAGLVQGFPAAGGMSQSAATICDGGRAHRCRWCSRRSRSASP
jgi:MFS superfamily sulfate permease-like transporter